MGRSSKGWIPLRLVRLAERPDWVRDRELRRPPGKTVAAAIRSFPAVKFTHRHHCWNSVSLGLIPSIHQWADIDLSHPWKGGQPGTHCLLIKHSRAFAAAKNEPFPTTATKKQLSFKNNLLQKSVDEGVPLIDSRKLSPDYGVIKPQLLKFGYPEFLTQTATAALVRIGSNRKHYHKGLRIGWEQKSINGATRSPALRARSTS